jgi:hypothetical protein
MSTDEPSACGPELDDSCDAEPIDDFGGIGECERERIRFERTHDENERERSTRS